MAKSKNQNLIVKYDAASDSLLLVVKKGREENFEEISPGVSVEFDKKGKILGFEILRASRYFRKSLPAISQKVKDLAIAR